MGGSVAEEGNQLAPNYLVIIGMVVLMKLVERQGKSSTTGSLTA